MGNDSPQLFSEAQLSQIATMIPALTEKSKLQSQNLIPISKEIKKDETPPVASADLGSANDETKKGLFRLSDFLQQKKKASVTQINAQVKKNVLVEFILVSSQKELKVQGLEAYAWVENAYLKTHVRGAHINRFF